ncbi:pentatricopeptide repeat-containing protein At5g02860 [Mercurialis annua]|uniref:pentatricopeptide repeat-containing protein At5g02860 n=1 Tax=Mercurialis annua TaxID=3986 RepID=UPI002160B32B|nr:pentatricopeptide repeat-containing protein At5g02860 [Mercurialis annua]
MAEKLALPLLLSNPPPSKPQFSIQTHNLQPPTSPIIQNILTNHQPNQPINPNGSITPSSRPRTRIGKARDPNRGKPWSSHRLSTQGQLVLDSLIDPCFQISELNKVLSQLFQFHSEQLSLDNGNLNSLSLDILGIIKGLGFYKKCELAISVFNWVRSRDDFHTVLNCSVVAVMVTMLGKEGKLSVAGSLLSSLRNDGFDLDVYAYTSLITAYASNGRYRDAVVVFKKMEEEGSKPTLITYNVILNVYGKMGMPWSKISGLVDGMKSSGVAPDDYTYNTLISCCRRGSLYEEAARVFEEMKMSGFSPDKVTYNALLDVYGKSRRPKEAMEVLKEMESNGFSPSIVTYNSSISAYARDGLLKEAMELKMQMVENGIKPDVFTYTTLLSGFEKAGMDEPAMRIFEEMRAAGCKPNICTFNALIKMHGNRGNFPEMMKVFEEIEICNCTPDIVTWNTLLAVFGQNGMDSEVSGVFREMKRAGFMPERDTFNTLISAYSRCGSFEQAMAVYRRMMEAGITPDLSSYNAVLAALARGGLWEQSEKVFSEMKDGRCRCKPNELTYCSLLHAYANGKEIERMHALAEEIYAGIIEPVPVLLKTLVLVNSKCDLLLETERAFIELNKKGEPDLSTLNTMIAIYGRRQMVAKANEILNFMNERGFSPSVATYNSLMYMYSRSENFERSEEVLKEILAKGLKPDIISYNTVIFAYCRNGRMKDASRIFSDMKDNGIVPDVITYNTFVATYAADSLFEEAIDVVKYMMKNGCKRNQNTYNSIVDGYCKHNRRADAITFVSSINELDPHVSKEEESRLSDRIAKKWY